MINSGVVTEIIGNHKVIIDGCDGIVDFFDDCIIIKSGKLKVSIIGKMLKIKILAENSAVIEGIVENVSYTYF